MADREYTNRKNNRLQRLIRKAGFDQSQANVNDINYQAGRKLNKKLIDRLSTCEYIQRAHNIIIAGATGTDKSDIACSQGMKGYKHYYATNDPSAGTNGRTGRCLG